MYYNQMVEAISGVYKTAVTNGWLHNTAHTVQLCEYCGCYGSDENNKCKSCGAPMIPVKEYEGVWNTSTG